MTVSRFINDNRLDIDQRIDTRMNYQHAYVRDDAQRRAWLINNPELRVWATSLGCKFDAQYVDPSTTTLGDIAPQLANAS